MKKILLSTLLLLVTTLSVEASLTADDNQYITAYNKEVSTVNKNFAALRTLDDYKDSAKRSKLENSFSNLKKIIKSFSDQKDSQVVSMQRNYKSMVTTYNKNLKVAGVGSKPQVSKSQKPLSELINDYNRIYNKSISDYNAMNSETAIKDSKKQAELSKDYKLLTASIEKLKTADAGVYKKAKSGYDSWVSAYKEKAKFFTASSTSATSSDVMTAQDRANLKKFRSLYIENDYFFRNVDTVRLQDPKYAKPLEDTLHKLQALLNPMRHKTFDRGIKRADGDLKKIEKIFESASSKSKELATSVSNIDEQLEAIQSVFDQRNFDPRLIENNIIDEIKTPQEVTQWAKRLKAYQAMIPDMKKFLQTARANTVKGREPAFAQYTHWFKNNVEDDIAEAILDKSRSWDTKIRNGIAPNKMRPDELTQQLQSQSNVKSLIENFEVGRKCLQNQMALEMAMDAKLSGKTTLTKNEYKAYDKKLVKAKRESLKNQKLPEAVTQNTKLISLAKSLMKKMGRKTGELSHMVIISDLRHSKELKYDGSWYMLRWDSFAVKFVEKVGNQYFINHAFFSKSIENKYGLTYGGKWYISGMSAPKGGDEIPKENL